MKIRYVMPIRDMSGSTRGPAGRTYYEHKGVKVSRQYVKTEIKNTQYQIRCQEILRLTSKAWKELSAQKIEKWNTFAARETVMNWGVKTTLSGIDWWNKVNFYNEINDGVLQEDPPEQTSRAFIGEVISFVLNKGHPEIAILVDIRNTQSNWCWVYFKLSPGYESPGRKPRAFEYRSLKEITTTNLLYSLTVDGEISIKAPIGAFDFEVGQYVWIKYLVLSFDMRPGDTGIFRTIIQEGA